MNAIRRVGIAGAFALAAGLTAGCQLGPGDYLAIYVNGGGGTLLIVSGHVTQGPIVPDGDADQPHEAPMEGAHVRIETIAGELVDEVVTDKDGRFATRLPAGRFRFVALRTSDERWPEPPPAREIAIAHATTDLAFRYDTGIR